MKSKENFRKHIKEIRYLINTLDPFADWEGQIELLEKEILALKNIVERYGHPLIIKGVENCFRKIYKEHNSLVTACDMEHELSVLQKRFLILTRDSESISLPRQKIFR
jgi:hypothetical protein